MLCTDETKTPSPADLAMLALLALAVALFCAMGGDGRDLEDHARWMAAERDAGAWVMW